MQQQATRYLKSALLLGVVGFVAGVAAWGPVGGQPAQAQGVAQGVAQGTAQGVAPEAAQESGAREASRPKSLLPEALQSAPVHTAPPRPLLPERLAPQNTGEAAPAMPGNVAPAGESVAGLPEAGSAPVDAAPARHREAIGIVGKAVQPGDAGLLTPATRGVAENSFAMSDGRFLATLARRIDAPLASRWAQILLARALVSKTLPPMHVAADDWLAARAAALLAMGSAADAHRMLEEVNPNDLTGASVAVYGTLFDAALGAADPMALCPLVPSAEEADRSVRWLMVEALCQSGEDADFEAATLFDELRGNKEVADVDIGLTEKLAASFGNGQRDAQIEWKEVERLDSWRLGMAVLAGEEIPSGLLDALPPRLTGWLVRMAAAPLTVRARLAPEAAAMGAISSAEARRLLAAAADEAGGDAQSPGALLRAMGNAANQSDRWKAYATLLKQKGARYGYQLAAANAAAGIAPTAAAGHMAPAIVESLVGAGLAEEALRWWPVAAQLGDNDRAQLWALLAPLSPEIAGDKAMQKVWQRRAEGRGGHRAALVLAGLAGLAGEAPATGAIDNRWTQALTAARQGQRPGEALLIVAAGLHGSWADVPPAYLQRMVRALSGLGFAREARLMVAEAATRG